jgi:hypothetical protein
LLHQENRADFIQKAYELADEERKYQILLSYTVPELEMNFVQNLFLEKQQNFDYQVIRHLAQGYQSEFTTFFLDHLQSIDNDTKYEQVKKVYASLHQENQADFIQKMYKMIDEEKQILVLLLNPDFQNEDDILKNWLLASNFLLLKPKKNKYYGFPLIKLMTIDIAYINKNIEVFDDPILSLVHTSLYRSKSHHHSNYVTSDMYNSLVRFVERTLNTYNFKELLLGDTVTEPTKINVIKNLKKLSNHFGIEEYTQDFFQNEALNFVESIKNDLVYFIKNEDEFIERMISIYQIDSNVCEEFLNNHIINFSTYVKLKLWVNDVYEVFDYNNYGFYYFRLNKYEKKRYNEKAKALMKEKLKKMMIAQRVPWEYNYTDENGINFYSASWRSVWFLDGALKICVKEVEEENIFSEPYEWSYCEEKFNFLFGYLSRKKVENLTIQEKNGKILEIIGLNILGESIYKANLEKEINEKGLNKVLKQEGLNKIPPSLIIKNQCVMYLNEIQDTDKTPTRILEISKDTNANVSADVSLLFTITKDSVVFVMWESLEFHKSKATHIFKMSVEEYPKYIEDISKFLRENLKVRSKLNSFQEEEKKKLRYLGRIDHDNFDFNKWINQLKSIIG